ncbi:hypothetical protein AX16_007240 [Volvariella volvacea WC 439]|nr:hypothetical protein AX16_007240 [Volvariella volvacea WC 439]
MTTATLLAVLQAVIALASLSLVVFTYERGLTPIYASNPTNLTLKYFVAAFSILGALQPIKASRKKLLFAIAALLSAAPNAAYWVPVLTSRKGDPTWGPAATHTAVLAPLVFAITLYVGGLKDAPCHQLTKNASPSVLQRVSIGVASYSGAMRAAKSLLPSIRYLNQISDSQIYLAISGLAYIAWIFTPSVLNGPAPNAPKKFQPNQLSTPLLTKLTLSAAFSAVWWALHPRLASPILPHPLPAPYDHPNFPLRTLSAVQSNTGLIVVAEALPPEGYDGEYDQQMHSVRYLRASHSILGGVWTGKRVMVWEGETPLTDLEGSQLGDSIYATFVLQEAVRLVNSTAKAKAGKLESALVIGLGTGISATAFQRHKISTTIVEIDPAVYDAAIKYFALPNPGPGKVFLEDARGWVATQRARVEAEEETSLFDFVVHDCFSGGGVPQHIYTLEFWDDVKKILQPDGLVVVNFAGIVKSDASRMVIFTLMRSFRQCRAFHDLIDELTPEKYETEFINMVIFCTQSEEPLSFRKTRTSDWLGSPLRRHVLQSLPEREVDLSELELPDEGRERFILTDARNHLGKLQGEQGRHHWSVVFQNRLCRPFWVAQSLALLLILFISPSEPRCFPVHTRFLKEARGGSSLSRPDWPWSSGTYAHRSSISSTYSPSSTPSPLSNQWGERSTSSSSTPSTLRAQFSSNSLHYRASPTPKQGASSAMITPGGQANCQAETTRQWTFMGFEWVVRGVHKLRDFVEGTPQPGEQAANADDLDDYEILKQSPIIGDNRFKLEIVRPSVNETDGEQSVKPTLSLYITCLTMDFAHSDYELSASMMTAIKCQEDRAGERGARPEWIWEFWQNDWVFRQESEVWECPLPPLSDLLKNTRIKDTDSLVICVQIHCPIGPSFPQHPSAYYVPRDLLEGLEASLDNANTGDVRFVCLERLKVEVSALAAGDDLQSPSSSSSSLTPFPNEMTARKRIIYAHADILTRRSEYFATMLSSSFAESASANHGERKVHTIVVEEADFETIYWLLKYCYANWLLFKEQDDPRVAVDGIGAGWSARWLNTRGSEWDWRTFRKVGSGDESVNGETRSATSLSTGTGEANRSTSGQSGLQVPETRTTGPVQGTRPPSSPTKTTTTARATTSTPRRVVSSGTNAPLPVGIGSSSATRSKTVPAAIVPASAHSSHYPVSPRAARSPHASIVIAPDPHPHPTPPPNPASALSIYQVAHRYAMPSLANLALEHIMNTITPQTAFAMLLATSAWEELRSLVEDYIVEKWDEVSVCEEFEKCCQEVAAGEWGPDGGKTLMTLFRRLRSPLGYSRT